MAIRIVRNEAGNCVNFVGTGQPAYWNACLSGEVNAEDSDRINIINDIRTAGDVENPVYEFYAIPFTEFRNADNEAFASATEAAEYITENANVTSGGTNIVAGPTDTFDFQRDATNTTVLIDNGDDHSVNSIKASVMASGLIMISEHGSNGATLYQNIYPENVTITGTSAGTSATGVVNALNALFQVTPLGIGAVDLSGTIPTSPAESIVTNKQEGQVPVTGELYGVGSDTSSGHGGRVWSDEVINQPGEYFEVKMAGKGRFILGLVDNNNAADIAELSNNSGNGHSGLQWGNAFYNYGTYTAPWTTYGTNSGLAYGPGWSYGGNDKMFRYNTEVQDDLRESRDGALFKVGITSDGYIAVWYYDLGRSNDWIMTARSSYVVPASDYRLVVKLWDGTTAIVEEPKIYNLAEDVPATTIQLADSASTLTLLGTAGIGIDSDTITITEASVADNNDGLFSAGSISQPGEFFQIEGHSGNWNMGIYNQDSGFDVSTLDASNGYDDTKAYYFGWKVLGVGTFDSADILRDSALDGAGASLSFLTGTDAHDRIRFGFDLSGKATLWAADSSVGDDWSVIARYNAAAPQGSYGLLLKGDTPTNGDAVVQASNITRGQLSSAPTLNFRYIESPDGSFYYPLFSSVLEANYVAQNIEALYPAGGYTNETTDGQYHSHIFPDDQSNTMWYMPNNVQNHADSAAPSWTGITFTEIPTAADQNYAPAAFSGNDQVWSENYAVNLQLLPQDVSWTQTVTGFPPELSYNSATGYLTGTTTYVPEDTTYTVTVTRSNAYGSSVGTFTITIQDNASLGDLADFTELAGNFVQPNRALLTHDFVMKYDTTISPGEELTYTIGAGAIPPTMGILSTLGDSAFDHFDSAGVALGSTSAYNFGETNKWDLRFVTFGGDVGEQSTKHNLVGWSDNAYISGNEGTNVGPEFKLEYDSADGYMRLYRGTSLLKTSASTFAGAQTIAFAGFDDQAQTDLYVPNDLSIQNSSYGSTQAPSGFNTPLLEGTMATSTLMGTDSDEDAVAQLTQALPVNHRMVFPQTWTETNVLPYSASGVSNKAFIGIPTSGADFTDVGESDFDAYFKIEGTSSTSSYQSRINTGSGGAATEDAVTVNSLTDAFFDYALEWDGDDLHVIACNVGDINTQPAINAGGSFFRIATETGYTGTGDLDVVIGVDEGAQVNLSTSGISVIRTPFGVNDILVGEASNGHGRYAQQPAASVFDDAPSGHAPSEMTYNAITTLNAGTTYRFIYHPSMETDDRVEFRLASDNTTVYTTGITTFGSGDPSFTGEYKGITFAVPADAPPLTMYYYNGFSSAYDLGNAISISGSTYVVPITGITKEGPAANQTGTNVMDQYDHGWISLNEQLSAGERLVLDNAFFADFLDETKGTNNIFAIGLKGDNWANTTEINSNGAGAAVQNSQTFKGNTYIVGVWSSGASNVTMWLCANGALGNSMYMNSASLYPTACAFLEITSDGDNIRAGFGRNNSTGNITQGDESTVAYDDWNAYKGQTGDQGYGITSIDVVMSFWTYDGGAIDGNEIDWTGLSEVSVPTPAATLTTPWNKALDFSGSSERTQQVNSSYLYNPLNMSNLSTIAAAPTTSGFTSDHGNSRPWATAVVFSSDNNSSNQHIWNNGEGAGSTDDNIYLRVDSNRNLYFGWGRTGALNECSLGTLSSGTGDWYGIYIAHTGERLSGADATPVNLADCFDIREINLSTGVVGSQMSQSTNWNTSGGRMDRQFTGSMTIGGRGSNRNFHGKVASMVSTTLMRNVAMPDATEISMMVRDPMQWLTDYKVGNSYRRPSVGTVNTNFQLNTLDASYGTQVWLMGDGTGDAYAQIRNQVYPGTQNNTPMNMISMVSSDIETVNINGLT